MERKDNILKMALLALSVLPLMQSCDKEAPSEQPPAEVSGPAKVLELDGKRLGHVGKYSITYDSHGRPSEIYAARTQMRFDYEQGIVYTILWGLDNPAEVEFNERGYITRLECSVREQYQGYPRKWNDRMTYTYDDEGHIILVTDHYSRIGLNDMNETYSVEFESIAEITWQDGNLVQVDVREEETIDDVRTGSDSYTVKYKYGTQKNEYRQFTIALTDGTVGTQCGFGPLAALGMFGIGSEMLPIEYMLVEDNLNRNLTYETNPNGTISKEKALGNLYEWYYYPIDNPVKVK